jgi:hypothetical protein
LRFRVQMWVPWLQVQCRWCRWFSLLKHTDRYMSMRSVMPLLSVVRLPERWCVHLLRPINRMGGFVNEFEYWKSSNIDVRPGWLWFLVSQRRNN